MKSKEDIPAEVFEWMAEQDFEGLSPERKETVLDFMSREDFDELHETVSGLRHSLDSNPGHNTRRLNILAAFDHKYGKQPKIGSAWYWKAAVMLLALSTTFTLVALRKQQSEIAQLKKISRETPEIIYDTLVMQMPVAAIEVNPEMEVSQKTVPGKKPSRTVKSTRPRPSGEYHIISVQELENQENHRRNSLKHDTLAQKIRPALKSDILPVNM